MKTRNKIPMFLALTLCIFVAGAAAAPTSFPGNLIITQHNNANYDGADISVYCLDISDCPFGKVKVERWYGGISTGSYQTDIVEGEVTLLISSQNLTHVTLTFSMAMDQPLGADGDSEQSVVLNWTIEDLEGGDYLPSPEGYDSLWESPFAAPIYLAIFTTVAGLVVYFVELADDRKVKRANYT